MSELKVFLSICLFFRLFHDFLDIYQPIFMDMYIYSLITICGVMLMIQMGIVEYFKFEIFLELYDCLLLKFLFLARK